MKTIIKAFAVTASLSTTVFAPVQAHAEIETLEECYAAVIQWCNETFPDHDCSQTSGLDDCDDAFGDAAGGFSASRIFAERYSDGTYRLRFEPTTAPTDTGERPEEGRGSSSSERPDDERGSTGETPRPADEPRDPTGATADR